MYPSRISSYQWIRTFWTRLVLFTIANSRWPSRHCDDVDVRSTNWLKTVLTLLAVSHSTAPERTKKFHTSRRWTTGCLWNGVFVLIKSPKWHPPSNGHERWSRPLDLLFAFLPFWLLWAVVVQITNCMCRFTIAVLPVVVIYPLRVQSRML